jgi:Na+/citrate or Na+/malate symporter
MFEHHHEKLLPRSLFFRRLFKYILILVFVSLIVGMIGYQMFEGFSWVDSFLNSSMLMAGMGPVGVLKTDAGKIFAGIYAMSIGLIELVAVGISAAPIVHRFLHHFHLESEHKQT